MHFSLPFFSMRNMETISLAMTGTNTSFNPLRGRISPLVKLQLVATCAWFGASNCFASLGTRPENPDIRNAVIKIGYSELSNSVYGNLNAGVKWLPVSDSPNIYPGSSFRFLFGFHFTEALLLPVSDDGGSASGYSHALPVLRLPPSCQAWRYLSALPVPAPDLPACALVIAR